MAVLMGPVLNFGGVKGNAWNLSAIVAVDGAGPDEKLAWSADRKLAGANAVAPELLAKFSIAGKPGARVLRYTFAVPQTGKEQQIFYRIGKGGACSFFVPAAGGAPQMAYASCNGFSDPKLMKSVGDKNGLWSDLAVKHDARHYHLLLLGGDQVYSDSIWIEVPELKAWCDLDWKERKNARFASMKKAVEDFYFRIYTERWMQTEPARMFASVPSMMMWDDHDIFDGWGSYPTLQHESDVYQGIFRVAREYFRVFQLGIGPGETRPGTLKGQDYFNFAHQVGKIGVLALDMRSERTEEQVMSLKSWDAVRDWMNSIEKCEHLLVLSSIPVVHPDFSSLEKFLGIFPGQQELEDDLRDHWNNRAHRQERLRLIHRLFEFAESKKCRVTLLSGDVHVAAVGVLQSDRSKAPVNARVINQLTSSGIVHPAPPGMVLYFLESVGGAMETVDRGITAEMAEFPATHHRFIGARNWLSLAPDDKNRIWANWYVEDEKEPYTKVVNGVSDA
jgi:hypothetical protein